MITDGKETGTYERQVQKIRETAEVIKGYLDRGHDVVVTHGNGPQVGNLLIQQAASDKVPGLPLRILGAMTQAQIGVLLELALRSLVRDREVVVVPTSVVVDGSDPGFQNPVKPIGPFFSDDEFSRIKIGDDEIYKSFPLGYRRVVASPEPLEIVEGGVIRRLIDDGVLVVAVGGGGTPVVRDGGLLEPVDAVIDKDRASAVLGDDIDADCLLIITNVDGAYRNFGKENQEHIDVLTVSEAERMVGEGMFGDGTMRPKVESCIRFVRGRSGRFAVITSREHALDALEGRGGTRIIEDPD